MPRTVNRPFTGLVNRHFSRPHHAPVSGIAQASGAGVDTENRGSCWGLFQQIAGDPLRVASFVVRQDRDARSNRQSIDPLADTRPLHHRAQYHGSSAGNRQHSALVHRRLGPGHTFRNILAWAAIAVVLFSGYSYRYELAAVKNRLMAELFPHQGVEVSGGAVSFRIGKNGHFVVEALVDGVRIRFLVDTGASDVVLRPRDAERLGFDIKALAYTRSYRTANGTVLGAPVRLRQVRIGPITMGDVRASVNGAPMKRSLLGMSFLGRLSGYEVSRETLTLRP